MSESWIQALAIVASNLVIMLTFFGVSVSLHNGLSRRIDESNKKIDENHKETHDLIRSIQEEMRDFHGRLCAIEERRNKS